MLNPEISLNAKILSLPLSTLFLRGSIYLFTHLNSDPHACCFHSSHLHELPVTLCLARRLGPFEFVQPNIHRLGSLHPARLDFGFGIIFHTDFQKREVLLPNPHATWLFLLTYISHFPSCSVTANLRVDSKRLLGVPWVSQSCVLPAAASGAYLLKILQFCVFF